MKAQAFSGLKILECSQNIAGSYCTKMFADFGAEVIKVERPKIGDNTRKMGPFLDDEPHQEKSGTFFYLNTNKKSITLNLESKTGVKIFKKLIKESDAFVESLAPGKLAEFGLSYKLMKELNDRLVITSITAFGQTGPYRDYKATNFTIYGLGGTMYTMRPANRPLARPAVEAGFQADYGTGVLSFIATIAALINQERTGGGTSVDIGGMECVASTLMGHTSEYSYMGLSRRTNPFAIHGYPIGYSVPCKDGWISVTSGIGGAPSIADLIGKPELREHPLFAKPRARMAEPEKFDEMITPWMKERGKWEITKKAQKLRLAFTPVLSPGELMEDEQIKNREFFANTQHPVMGDVTYPGAPAKYSETPRQAGRAPLLGEHNEEIYSNLGYTMEEISKWQQKGII